MNTQERMKALEELKKALSKFSGQSFKRRSIFQPKQVPKEVNNARQRIYKQDYDELMFQWSQLIKNGWTLKEEREYARHAKELNLKLYSMNPPLDMIHPEDYKKLGGR